MYFNLFLSFISGLVVSWAFPPGNYYFLAWVGLVPFYYAIFLEKNLKKLAWYSLAFALPFYGVIVSSFTALFDLVPAWLIVMAMLAFALGQTVFIVLTVLLFRLMVQNLPFKGFAQKINTAIVLAALWVVLDWLRSLGIFGNTAGGLVYSQYLNLTFIQLARYLGPYGLTFVLVCFNALIALGLQDLIARNKKDSQNWLKTFFVVLVVFTAGNFLLQQELKPVGETKRVTVFQPAVPQGVKMDYANFGQLKKMYLNSLRAYAQLHETDLIILPETIVPEFLLNDKKFMFDLRDAIDSTVIFGVPRLRDRNIWDGYFNSVVLMNKYGDVTVLHDKKYLVPFGEYIPFRNALYWLVKNSGFLETEYTPGFKNKATASYATAVCFESLLPYQLREQVRSGGKLLIVITNDAWYKNTPMLEMHLSFGVLRAVENNRYLVQAANTGVSALVDNHGRIIESTEIDERTWLSGDVQMIKTPTLYNLLGEVIIYLAGIYLLVLVYILLLGLPGQALDRISRTK